MTSFPNRIFYRMHDGFDDYLLPAEVIDRMDHDLWEIRYRDPFIKELDGTHATIQKFVHSTDLILPDEFDSL